MGSSAGPKRRQQREHKENTTIQRDDKTTLSKETINPCSFMLRGAGAGFIAVNAERDNHIIRGLLKSKDEAHRATLAYERSGHKVRLTVFLDLQAPLCEQNRILLDRLQGASAFSRFDPEGQELKLSASSVSALGRHLIYAVRQIVRDVQAVLADDRLQAAMGV